MTTAQFYNRIRSAFESAGFDSSDIEAAYLLSEVTGLHHTLVASSAREITKEEEAKAHSFLDRRLKNEPFQYIYGWAQFRDLRLSVASGCLIPRPETEYLLDFILKALPRNASVCELGAGSGAISLALASERSDLRVAASELSPAALVIARKNAFDLGLSERVRLEEGDLFSPFAEERFDAIVANLPYVEEESRSALPANVQDYEPALALFAPDGGFAVIERALQEAPAHLNVHGKLFFEIGETQGERALRASEAFPFHRIVKDQYGADRYLFAGL